PDRLRRRPLIRVRHPPHHPAHRHGGWTAPGMAVRPPGRPVPDRSWKLRRDHRAPAGPRPAPAFESGCGL
ncbi:MAG TPA: hypothetical protein VFH03_23295, partial [Actinoplanes sp.]|nr:hypothetical protein [Actinoplanes sp.]